MWNLKFRGEYIVKYQMGVHVSSDPCHWPMRALVTSACSPIGPHYQTKPHNVLSGCNDERVQASTDAQSPSVTLLLLLLLRLIIVKQIKCTLHLYSATCSTTNAAAPSPPQLCPPEEIWHKWHWQWRCNWHWHWRWHFRNLTRPYIYMKHLVTSVNSCSLFLSPLVVSPVPTLQKKPIETFAFSVNLSGRFFHMLVISNHFIFAFLLNKFKHAIWQSFEALYFKVYILTFGWSSILLSSELPSMSVLFPCSRQHCCLSICWYFGEVQITTLILSDEEPCLPCSSIAF